MSVYRPLRLGVRDPFVRLEFDRLSAQLGPALDAASTNVRYAPAFTSQMHDSATAEEFRFLERQFTGRAAQALTPRYVPKLDSIDDDAVVLEFLHLSAVLD